MAGQKGLSDEELASLTRCIQEYLKKHSVRKWYTTNSLPKEPIKGLSGFEGNNLCAGDWDAALEHIDENKEKFPLVEVRRINGRLAIRLRSNVKQTLRSNVVMDTILMLGDKDVEQLAQDLKDIVKEYTAKNEQKPMLKTSARKMLAAKYHVAGIEGKLWNKVVLASCRAYSYPRLSSNKALGTFTYLESLPQSANLVKPAKTAKSAKTQVSGKTRKQADAKGKQLRITVGSDGKLTVEGDNDFLVEGEGPLGKITVVLKKIVITVIAIATFVIVLAMAI